jgi:hypothetical protein
VFEHYRPFLDAGLLVFRQILSGRQPSSLRDVLPFACLVRAMEETMEAAGHDTRCLVDKIEMDHWLKAMELSLDKCLFAQLAPILWPKWHQEPATSTQRLAPLWPDVDLLRSDKLVNDAQKQGQFLPLLDCIFDQTSGDEAFDFSKWLEYRPGEEFIPRESPGHIRDISHSPSIHEAHEPSSGNPISTSGESVNEALEGNDPRALVLVTIAILFLICEWLSVFSDIKCGKQST